MAVHTQGGAHKRRSVATAGVLLFKGPRARRHTQKAVHIEGGAHNTRSVATAGVLLFKRGVQGLAPASSEASRFTVTGGIRGASTGGGGVRGGGTGGGGLDLI